MTLDMKTALFQIVLPAVWLVLSYFTFNVLGDQSASHRIWVDRTLARRIFWVIFSPGFAVIVLVYGIIGIRDVWDEVVVRRWNNWVSGRSRRKRIRRRRRDLFFDSVKI